VHTTTLLTLQKFIYSVFYFFPCNRSVKKCDLFLFWLQSCRLTTRFQVLVANKWCSAIFVLHINYQYVSSCSLALLPWQQVRPSQVNLKSGPYFLRRYRTKPNIALESKATFVHLNSIVEHAIRVNESFAFLTLTVNNYWRHLKLGKQIRCCFICWFSNL
jgi:hypothetical protein